MYGNRAEVLVVLRHFKSFVAGLSDVGVVARDEQRSVGVISAGISYKVSESLVYFVEHLVRLVLRNIFFPAAALFVERLENKMLVEVLEFVSYLFPHSGVALHSLVLIGSEGLSPPAAVPVDIYDNVQIGVYRPLSNFLNSVESVLVDSVCSVALFKGIRPSHWYSDRAEALVSHALYHCLSYLRTAPACFKSSLVSPASYSCFNAAGLESVSEVYAYAHVFDYISHSHLFSACCGSRNRAAYACRYCRCRESRERSFKYLHIKISFLCKLAGTLRPLIHTIIITHFRAFVNSVYPQLLRIKKSTFHKTKRRRISPLVMFHILMYLRVQISKMLYFESFSAVASFTADTNISIAFFSSSVLG